MVKKSGLIIAGAILLAGLTAAIALGATYAPNNIGANYAVPQSSIPSTTTPQPYGWGGMMGGGRGGGMMGYGYPATNPNTAFGWSGMWTRCAGFMNSLWQNPQGQQTNQVIVAGYSFAPQVITVKADATVTWTNYDSVTHSITSGTPTTPSTLFDSGELAQGQSFNYIFATVGVYTYYCDQHTGMTGVIIVEA